MMIIGCDLHTRYQQIAMLDTDTGELVERRLEHESGEARAFYAGLSGEVRVGIETTGHTHWFEAMLAELRARAVDGRCGDDSGVCDSQAEDRCAGRGAFVESVARGPISPDLGPSPAKKDLRQLVWHRQKLVWMRGAVKNQLHALASILAHRPSARPSSSLRPFAVNSFLLRHTPSPIG